MAIRFLSVGIARQPAVDGSPIFFRVTYEDEERRDAIEVLAQDVYEAHQRAARKLGTPYVAL
jgi:hypothetical protein